MYRREGTVYVRMWGVVRGRVPTILFCSLCLFVVPIHFDVYVGWCYSSQFARLIVPYRRIYFVRFSFVVLVFEEVLCLHGIYAFNSI